ncbi:MAG: molybdopterin-dependent oxidoreductase [Alphaproteobacteria bacterium]|nr:molybdopterin-dependent oxidoreductase [Alphaproteobacteria bacterium]
MTGEVAVAQQAEIEKYVGQSVERVEDSRLLTGRARFADHYPVPQGTLHGAVLRSPHASAEIVSIDVSKAEALPGVRAVYTGEDIKAISDPFLVIVKQPLNEWALAVDRVRFVGEAVAVVVARDRYIAEDALDLVEVTYNALTPIIDAEAATAEGAPLVHVDAGTNVMSDRNFIYGDPEKAFADADQTVSLKLEYPRNSLTPIEAFVAIVEYMPDDDVYDVLSNFQGPYTGHPVMARSFRVAESNVRLRTPANSGGSFGVKQAVLPYIVLMGLCSKLTGKPVKWVEDRLEHLTAASSAPNRVVTIEAAIKNDGEMIGMKIDQLDDYGAYLRSPMPGPLYRMHGALSGAYKVQNLDVTNRLVMTNKIPGGLVRGFGGPQMYFAIERLMHKVAVTLGLDPLDVIRTNLLDADVFPYQAPAGALYDSGDYPKAVEMAVEQGGLDELLKRRDEARAEGKIYGIGYTALVEPGMSNMGYLSTIVPVEERRKRGSQDGAISMATVNVDPLGSVSVTSDTTPQGQGHGTVLSQIVADQLGLRPEDIRVNVEHDTHKDPWSIAAGTYSCRFSPGTAVAAQLAGKKVRDKLSRISAQLLNVPADQVEFAGGQIFDRENPDNTLSFRRIAGGTHWSPGLLPDDMDAALRETATWAPQELTTPDEQDRINTSLTYGFVFDFCGIEIDPDTAEIRIDKYVTMHDAGTLMNPMIVEGQVYGSYGQGIGAAMYEEFHTAEDGSFQSGTFADYLVPTAYEVPEPVLLHMESPSPFTPLGAKGAAEGNCMSTPVCLANAVCDALSIDNIVVPLTPAKISEFLHGEEQAAPAGTSEETKSDGAEAALTGEGDTFVPADPQKVWDTLLDPVALAAVIPGCHKLDLVAENEYQAEVSLGVGPVRGKFNATVKLSDLDAPTSATVSGGLEGPLGSSAGSGKVTLEARDGGTFVQYSYSVEIGGKVAAIGGRMLEGAAKIVVGQFFERLTAQVGGKPVPTPTGSWWQKLLSALGLGK